MNKKKKQNEKTQEQIFNLQDEIVIGINSPKALEEKKKLNNNVKNTNNKPKETKNVKKIPSKKVANKKNNKLKLLLKWICLILLLIGAAIYFLMSPLFNIKNIIITGENKVSEKEIEALSQLAIGQNIFNFSKLKTKEYIQENSYIASVEIDRKFPNTVNINVIERVATFLVPIGSSYMYLDNQGYALELAEEKLEVPILTSIDVDIAEFRPGDRIKKEDLIKLEQVIAIVSSAKNNEIYDKINSIDIKNESNYILAMTDNKTVYLGNINNLNVKMLYLKRILQDEQGIEGEIFLQSDNKEMFFREKI